MLYCIWYHFLVCMTRKYWAAPYQTLACVAHRRNCYIPVVLQPLIPDSFHLNADSRYFMRFERECQPSVPQLGRIGADKRIFQ